jgi:hypothetical protein
MLKKEANKAPKLKNLSFLCMAGAKKYIQEIPKKKIIKMAA